MKNSDNPFNQQISSEAIQLYRNLFGKELTVQEVLEIRYSYVSYVEMLIKLDKAKAETTTIQ